MIIPNLLRLLTLHHVKILAAVFSPTLTHSVLAILVPRSYPAFNPLSHFSRLLLIRQRPRQLQVLVSLYL